MGNLIGDIRHALRQFWTRPRLHRHRGADAGHRHRRHDRDLHADPRGDAAVAAGQRPGPALPHRRRRQLLRAGRHPGSLGHVLVSAVRAAEGRPAGVRGADGLPGRPGPRQRTPAGRRADGAGAAIELRRRQLLLDARRARVRRPRVHAGRRHRVGPAGRRDEPSRLDGHLRRRSEDRRRHAGPRRPPVHGRRHHRPRLLRRDAARRSARPVDPAAPGAADRRRDGAAAPAGVGVAARDRPAEAGRDDRRHARRG